MGMRLTVAVGAVTRPSWALRVQALVRVEIRLAVAPASMPSLALEAQVLRRQAAAPVP